MFNHFEGRATCSVQGATCSLTGIDQWGLRHWLEVGFADCNVECGDAFRRSIENILACLPETPLKLVLQTSYLMIAVWLSQSLYNESAYIFNFVNVRMRVLQLFESFFQGFNWSIAGIFCLWFAIFRGAKGCSKIIVHYLLCRSNKFIQIIDFSVGHIAYRMKICICV